MHADCIILRSKTVGFWVMGPCSLNGQHRQCGLDLLLQHLMACVDRPKMLLQNIHNHVCTRLCDILTQTILWILSTVSTSNPIPKIIKNWNVNGNVTSRKLNYRRAVYIFTSSSSSSFIIFHKSIIVYRHHWMWNLSWWYIQYNHYA